MQSNELLERLEAKGSPCTGCAACNNICPKEAIEMRPDPLGFRHPYIRPELCVDCGLCLRTCPLLNTVRSTNDPQPDCYALQASDSIRGHSSSGGAFTLLAESVLSQGGMVFGAAMDSELQTRHVCICSPNELISLCKSKYVQSDIGQAYRKAKSILVQGQTVLFSGTPCQIAGLYAYLHQPYEKLYTVDILCHGVPSQQMLQDSLRGIVPGRQVAAIDFRDKQYGWECLGMTLHLDNGSKRRLSYDESRYEQGFHPNMILRESCYNCPFCQYPRMGDVTIGDFWRVADYDPALADGKGTSALLINSEKGQHLFEQIHPKAAICTKVPLSFLDSNRVTPMIPKPPERDTFLALYPKRPFNQSVLDAQQNRHDVGIVGNWSYPNYGSELTYYALYHTVTRMGYTAVMLSWPRSSHWKPYQKAQLFLQDPYPPRDIAEIPDTRDDLVNYNARCDAFILGSDQLLNDNLYNWFDRFAQLDWVYSNKKKIAYAASFGTDYIWGLDEDRAELAHFLQEFDFVSSRESSGRVLLKERFGVDAQQVLDPVFLPSVSFYSDLAKIGSEIIPNTPYLFTYVLDNSSADAHTLQQCSLKLQLPIFSVTDAAPQEHRQPGGPGENRVMLEEWVSCIQNCDYMITDSFHGMCLAILFHRPFLAICNDSRGATRFVSILSLLGMENRLVENGAELQKDLSILLQPIDYNAVDKELETLKRQSEDWLRHALEEKLPSKTLSTYDLLHQKILTLQKRIDETDSKQWQQLEDHRQRLDGLDARFKDSETKQQQQLENHRERLDSLDVRLGESDAKQWQQLEDHRQRLDGLDAQVNEQATEQGRLSEIYAHRLDILDAQTAELKELVAKVIETFPVKLALKMRKKD